jgi:hypothetical protein
MARMERRKTTTVGIIIVKRQNLFGQDTNDPISSLISGEIIWIANDQSCVVLALVPF